MAPREMPISPSDAVYVVQELLKDRVISPALVRKIQARKNVEMRQLQERLAFLNGGSTQRRPARSSGKARQPLSAETQASRQLQGQYLNLIRRVPLKNRAMYRKLAKAEGREAAIKAMRKDLQE